MDVAKLEELFAPQVTVKHRGQEYVLQAPDLATAGAVMAEWSDSVGEMEEGDDARPQYMSAVARAIELTLVVDGALPSGIGQRIILGTGGIGSPIGQAAAKLCGLPLLGAPEVPDDLPT